MDIKEDEVASEVSDSDEESVEEGETEEKEEVGRLITSLGSQMFPLSSRMNEFSFSLLLSAELRTRTSRSLEPNPATIPSTLSLFMTLGSISASKHSFGTRRDRVIVFESFENLNLFEVLSSISPSKQHTIPTLLPVGYCWI